MTAILLLLAGTLAVLFLRHPRGERAAQTVRFSIPIPPGTTYAPSEISRGVSISPDGTRIVVEAISNGRPRLFARPLDLEKFTELEGSVGARAHFWSPDGRFIAFYADGKLKKIPAAGGPAEELCPAHYEFVGTWSREGTILFAEIPPAAPGIYSVSDKGGEPVRILAPDPARPSSALWPQFLPGGQRYLYQGFLPGRPGRRQELKVASLGAKETRTIAPLDSRFEYAEPGYLVYVRDNALFAQPFDEKRTVLHGEPILLADGVRHFFGPGNASFSISHTGAVVYEAAKPALRLAWFDRQGREIATLGQPAVVEGLRISPEGGRVAVDVLDSKPGTSDLWLYELASGVSTRLNAGELDEVQPVWSPDGTKLLFRSDEKGPPDVHEMVVGSPGSERPVLEQPGVQEPADISPNGRLLVYLEDAATTPDIWLLPLEGDRKPRPWVRSPFNERSPRFSPDGRWIAYESDESGTPEVYAALTDGAGEKKRLSTAGGRQPRWRRDGKELDYIAPDGSIMTVSIALGAKLEAGTPTPLFHVETGVRNFDLTPDGNRFLVSTPVEKSPESPIRVILNWDAALQKKS